MGFCGRVPATWAPHARERFISYLGPVTAFLCPGASSLHPPQDILLPQAEQGVIPTLPHRPVPPRGGGTTHPAHSPPMDTRQDACLAPTLSPAMHRVGLITFPLGTRLGLFFGLTPPGTHSTFFFFFFCICESGSLVEAFLGFFFFSFFSLSFFSKGRK